MAPDIDADLTLRVKALEKIAIENHENIALILASNKATEQNWAEFKRGDIGPCSAEHARMVNLEKTVGQIIGGIWTVAITALLAVLTWGASVIVSAYKHMGAGVK